MEAMADLHMPQEKRLLAALQNFEENHVQGRTIEGYISDLKIFKVFMTQRGMPDPLVNEIMMKDLVAFYNTEAARVSVSTLRRRFCALRKFFDWAVGEGYAVNNLAKKIRLPTISDEDRRCLSKEEVERLIQMAKYQSIWGARDRAILSLLYYSGLRVTELCDLDTNSISENLLCGKPGVRVARGKGGKERKIPIGKKAMGEYKNWERMRHLANPKDNAIFINKYGARITSRAVFDIVRKYSRQAGLGDDVSPHALRHTFAMVLVKDRTNPKIIQELMGHATVDMSMKHIYHTEEEYVHSIDALE